MSMGMAAFRLPRTVGRVALTFLVLALLAACQERPLTSQEIQDQHRFATGCRPSDYARDSTEFMSYCDHIM